MGCSTKLPFGIIAKKNDKIINFMRDVQFNAVINRKQKNFIGYVYSGIAILKKKLLENNFKDYVNFETLFYPSIIKKRKRILCKSKAFGIL